MKDLLVNSYEEEEERIRRREQRKERHIVSELCSKVIRFESVKQEDLNRRSRGLCFGSKTERIVLPVKDSYFDPKFSLYKVEQPVDPEDIPSEKKITTGSWGFSSIVPRFNSTDILQTSEGRYFPKEDFNSQKIRLFSNYLPRSGRAVNLSDTPGPGTYRPQGKPHKPSNNHSFGGPSRPKPAWYTLCTVFNEALCLRCQKAPPTGDFFHCHQRSLSLCRLCFLEEQKSLDKIPKAATRLKKSMYLDSYQQVRYCDFFHSHLSSEKAIQHLTNTQRGYLRKKLGLENYLHKYGNRSLLATATT